MKPTMYDVLKIVTYKQHQKCFKMLRQMHPQTACYVIKVTHAYEQFAINFSRSSPNKHHMQQSCTF